VATKCHRTTYQTESKAPPGTDSKPRGERVHRACIGRARRSYGKPAAKWRHQTDTQAPPDELPNQYRISSELEARQGAIMAILGVFGQVEPGRCLRL